MDKKLSGKIAIVTGGCRGIGLSIVERLASDGAFVYALDYVIPDGPISEIPEIQDQLKTIQVDVTDYQSVTTATDLILKEKNRIDYLVNNAGITRDNLMLRMSEQEWDSVITTNLKGAFLCSKAVMKQMMSQRYGRIINIGSVVGLMGNAGQANYSASKAGLVGFSKSLAKELGSRNILCNLIAPGFVITPMTHILNEEQKKSYLANIPLKRAAEPKDIANVVAFLVSDDSSYVTGQVINVDGGLAM